MAIENYQAREECGCTEHSKPQNVTRLGELIEAACANFQPAPTPQSDREPVELALSLALTFFPSDYYLIEKISVEGDKIAVRWQPRTACCARRTAHPRIGKQEQPTGLTLMRYANGQIVDVRESWDRMDADTRAENKSLVS